MGNWTLGSRDKVIYKDWWDHESASPYWILTAIANKTISLSKYLKLFVVICVRKSARKSVEAAIVFIFLI